MENLTSDSLEGHRLVVLDNIDRFRIAYNRETISGCKRKILQDVFLMGAVYAAKLLALQQVLDNE